MANNPSVTLTFAGDSKQVSRAMKDVGNESDQLRDKIDRNSSSMARSTAGNVLNETTSMTTLRREYSKTGESYEDMINRMVRAKRRADQLQKNIEFLGLSPAVGGTDVKSKSKVAGQDAGDSFATGFSGKVAEMLPKLLNVGTATGIAAAAVPAAGVAGLLAGGALVTGLGAGLAGLGLMFAAKSEPIKLVFGQLGTDLVAQMTRMSKPFQKTLLDMERDIREVFSFIAPEFEKAFPDTAKELSEFSDSLVDAFKQLAPAIQPIMFAFREILDDLGPMLPGVFQDIANALITLSGTVANNSDGFANFVVAFLSIIPAAIEFINWMINVGTWFVNTVRDIVDFAQGMADGVIGAFRAIGDFISGFAGWVGDSVGRAKEAVSSRLLGMIQDFRNWPAHIRDAVGDLGNVLVDAGFRLVGGLISGIKSKFNEVKATLANLTSMLPNWKGPVEVDAKLLTENGRLIIGSLVAGFRQEEPDVRAYLGQLTSFIGGFGPDAGRLSEGSSGSSSGGRTEHVVRFGSDGSRLGDAVLSLVQEAIRERGGDPAVLGV